MSRYFVSASPLAVTLNKIFLDCPSITQDRLSEIPDDQLLFFWAESSVFTISGPVKWSLSYSQRDCEIQRFQILDPEGQVVGITGACRAMGTDEVGMIKTNAEFIAIANNRPVEHPAQKIVLQVERCAGIAYRINIAEIREDAWIRSMPRTILNPLA